MPTLQVCLMFRSTIQVELKNLKTREFIEVTCKDKYHRTVMMCAEFTHIQLADVCRNRSECMQNTRVIEDTINTDAHVKSNFRRLCCALNISHTAEHTSDFAFLFSFANFWQSFLASKTQNCGTIRPPRPFYAETPAFSRMRQHAGCSSRQSSGKSR